MKKTASIAVFLAPLLVATVAAATPARHVHHVRKPTTGGGISVVMDQARLVTFLRPVKTVFVGDPTVADVNIVDSRHTFILGKTFGVTNIIALDANGAQIENKQITVVNHQAAVTLNRGPDQYNLSCTLAHCEVTPRPGDPKAYLDNTEQAVTEHQDLGNKNAMPASGAGQSAVPTD